MRFFGVVVLSVGIVHGGKVEVAAATGQQGIDLAYSREFGYRATGGLFFNSIMVEGMTSYNKKLDWFCTLKFDPVDSIASHNTKELSAEDVSDALDKLTDYGTREDLKQFLTDRLKGQFCIDTPAQIRDNTVELVEAKLTRSQQKDQAALHCTYQEYEKMENDQAKLGAARTVSYTIPDKYASDLLIQEKYNLGISFFTKRINPPQGYELRLKDKKLKDNYNDKNLEITDADTVYGADLWCTAIIEKRRDVEKYLSEFLASLSKIPAAGKTVDESPKAVQAIPKPNIEYLGGDLDVSFTHGARFTNRDKRCAMTFFGIKSADVGLKDDFDKLVSMNHQGLCFAGETLPDVVEAPPSLSRAVLEKDPLTKNPVLKCFEYVEVEHKGEKHNIYEIAAEYRLPFHYHPAAPLGHLPEPMVAASKTDKNDDASAGQPGMLTRASQFFSGSSKKANGDTEEKDVSFGRARLPTRLTESVSATASYFGRGVAYVAGYTKSDEGIEFIDKYDDPFKGTDKTPSQGLLAKQYCSHLMYMRDAFHALVLTREKIPAVRGFSDLLKILREDGPQALAEAQKTMQETRARRGHLVKETLEQFQTKLQPKLPEIKAVLTAQRAVRAFLGQKNKGSV